MATYGLGEGDAADFREMQRRLRPVDGGTAPNLGAAGGGRNIQPVKRVTGDPVTGDGGRDIYPGKIIWLPADGSLDEEADCWLDPAITGHAPDVGTPVLAVQNGYFSDTDGDDNPRTLPVFWAFGRSLCPGTDTPGYDATEGVINVVTLDSNGCVLCVQPEECS